MHSQRIIKMSWYHSIIVFLLFCASRSVKGNFLISRPSLVTKEGENAELPCLTSGEGDILTWRKGHNFTSSEFVASLNGENNLNDRSYVSSNGTLHIFNLTQDDHGNYFCRKASKTNDCNVEISLLLQDRRSSIFIDQCQPHKDCVIFTDDSENTFTLTCTALFVSNHTVLKWFNGEKQLNSKENTSTETNSASVNISSTTIASVSDRVNLQCFAFDERVGKIDGMSAFVQIVTEHNTCSSHLCMTTYVLAAILLVVLLCVFGFVCYKLLNTTRDNPKRKEKIEEGELDPLNNGRKKERKKGTKEQLQMQLNGALAINQRLKLIAGKVDKRLILRLEPETKSKTTSMVSSLSSFVLRFGKGVYDIEQDLENLTGVDCVTKRGSLDESFISSEPVKDLLEISVYGWNSFIILNFEGETEDVVVQSLQNICTGLYDVIAQVEANGFQVENEMNFTKLGQNELPADEPKVIESLQSAQKFIADRVTKDFPLAVEFQLGIVNFKGMLKVVVLEDIKDLPSAVGIGDSKPVESQQCKTLIVIDGSLGDEHGKGKIREILKQIKTFRNH